MVPRTRPGHERKVTKLPTERKAYFPSANFSNSVCPYTVVVLYRVIHKSLRDFRTRLRNNQDRHGRKEHINKQRISPSFFFFVLGALAYFQVPPLWGSRDEKWRSQ